MYKPTAWVQIFSVDCHCSLPPFSSYHWQMYPWSFEIKANRACWNIYILFPFSTVQIVRTKLCFLVRKSQIRKFLGSFRYRKSAKKLCVPVRKSQIRKFLRLIRKSKIRKFLQNTSQLCLKTVLYQMRVTENIRTGQKVLFPLTMTT